MNDAVYKLEELARAAGTSARTVRYYVQRGLLPAPAFRGKDTAYAHGHLVRLRAIRRLQEAFFPLDTIAAELERRSLEEIGEIADGKRIPSAASVLASEPPPAEPDVDAAADALDAPPSEGASAERGGRQIEGARPSAPRSGARERVFRRIELAPGVELSVADDAPSESKRLVEKILQVGGVP